jgi:hypothetical protein
VEPAAPQPIDEREVRSAQAAVGVLLLGAFVFRVPPLVAGVTVVVAIGAAVGPAANAFHAVYRAVVGPRLKPPEETVPTGDARALDLLATGLLLLACAAFLVGIDVLGWFFTLVEAAIAVVTATTGFNAANAILERLRPNR